MSVPSGKVTVLVVQQEEKERERMVSILAEETVRVLSAADGRAALELLRAHRPEILVTDMALKHVDGFTLIQKAQDIVEDIKIIVVFGPYNSEELALVVELGVEAFIPLPAEEAKLRQAVAESAHDIAQSRRIEQADYSMRQLLDFFPGPAVLVDNLEVVYMNRPLTSYLGYEKYEQLAKLDMGLEDFIIRFNDEEYDGDSRKWIESMVNDPIDHDYVLHVENPRHPEARPNAFGVTFNQFPDSDLRLFTFQDVSGLEDDKTHFEGEASIDPLTGAFNRRSFMGELSQLSASGKPFGLIMFDIDHFKSINDTFGHDVGDTVLKEISDVVRRNIRMQDIMARWGGEEFMVLSPGAGPKLSARVAERLRERVAGFTFTGVSKAITASFGVVIKQPNDSVDELLRRVDQALYRAKESGRNTIVTDD